MGPDVSSDSGEPDFASKTIGFADAVAVHLDQVSVIFGQGSFAADTRVTIRRMAAEKPPVELLGPVGPVYRIEYERPPSVAPTVKVGTAHILPRPGAPALYTAYLRGPFPARTWDAVDERLRRDENVIELRSFDLRAADAIGIEDNAIYVAVLVSCRDTGMCSKHGFSESYFCNGSGLCELR
jgi:hypothetical protein